MTCYAVDNIKTSMLITGNILQTHSQIIDADLRVISQIDAVGFIKLR